MNGSNQLTRDKQKILHQEHKITTLKGLLVYYKEITETVREPFIILDKELHVVTANLAFYRKFKVHKRDTEGKRIYELGNNQWDARELRELLERILPKHRVFSNYEVTHDFPFLGQRIMLLNARQVDSKQLILLAIEDVTAKRKLKVDADEMTANLILQRNQLQGLNNAKEEFISLASHQLRTPATEVKQYIDMLADGYAGKLSTKQMDMLKIARNSNERQLEIIEDLLRVARVDAGKVYLEKSSCDIIKQVRSVIRGQAVLFKSREQRVILEIPDVRVVAFIDPKLMRMVVDNLLDNAGKYSANGKDIVITVSQSKSATQIAIADSGVGMHKSDYNKLFKKFSRIDNPMSSTIVGTGLGLYWVKKIIDLHDGTIEVMSKPNGGSTFTVKMPVSDAGYLT